MTHNWLILNKLNWNERVPIHLQSSLYNTNGFIAGKSSLHAQVLKDLSPVKGKNLIHLQCHFGLDTLSWAREGAVVIGVDFSEAATRAAQNLARETKLKAMFLTANVYDAPALLNNTYDIVYTGMGALCWLPDIERWAKTVSLLLKPGGELYLREFHPAAWVFDGNLKVAYSYFTPPEGELITEKYTYTGDKTALRQTKTRQWNHPIDTIVSSLMYHGITVTSLHESEECEIPYLAGMEKQENGLYRFPSHLPNLPATYTLRARKD